jgi:hypothetical protein
VSPAVTKLLAAADEVLVMAKDLRKKGLHAESLAFALHANEYVRAARSMQTMETAAADYEKSKETYHE